MIKRLWPLVTTALLVGASCSEDDTNDTPEDRRAAAAELCDPACDANACSYCDTGGPTPTCVSVCDEGLTCQAGTCLAAESTDCGGCGPCEVCDSSGAAPICVSTCAEGTQCENNRCEVVLACDPACDASGCEVCDTTGETAQCVSRCGDGVTCSDGTCEVNAAALPHASLAALQGPFDTPQQVTAECLVCHEKAGEDFIQTVHWNWRGDAPNFTDVDGNPDPRTDLGKRDLINNFCVAIDSNEARCSQCHAGYGYGAPASENNPTFDFSSTANVDCLVCHASPDSGYVKDKKTAGLPASSVDLAVAAQSVGGTSVQSCGSCHFYAGGGDNVKKGDLGSALLTATRDADVHMGGDSPANRCSSCHAGEAHTITGQGIHLPTQEGRASCTDCHKDPVHPSAVIELHVAKVACQTCHIGAFSRQQPTKMAWDWTQAGDKTRTPAPTAAGPDDYNWMKGEFDWEQNVVPRYAWYDGRAYHTLTREGFEPGMGTLNDPVLVSAPTAGPGDGKIFPFKVMVGQQFVDITGMSGIADTNAGTADTGCGESGAEPCPTPPFLIVPDLFGPGGFWGTVGARDDDNRPATKPTEWDIWLGNGAEAGGQVAAVDAYSRDVDPRQWDFAYTEMWMGINHEVAPKEAALQCSACHSAEDDHFFIGLGYTCDPREASDCRPWVP